MNDSFKGESDINVCCYLPLVRSIDNFNESIDLIHKTNLF